MSKKVLAFVLITFILLSFKIELHTTGLWQTNFFRYFPLAIDLAIQPLIYIYVLSLTKGFRLFDRKLLWHFSPALIFMVHASVVYATVYAIPDLVAKDKAAEGLYFNRVKEVEDYLSVISAVIYWVVSYKSVAKYNQTLFNQTTSGSSPLSWLKNLLIITAVLIFALTVNIFSDNVFHLGNRHFFHWQLFYIVLSLIIYYISFAGYYHPDFIPVVNSANAAQFSRADIDNTQKAILYQFEINRIFLEQDISLITLANKIKLSQSVVSVTINQEFAMNFRNLVNGYRVEEVKKKLTDPGFQHLSILGIALESGFNSEASFYRAFKKHTGISPTDYLNMARINGQQLSVKIL